MNPTPLDLVADWHAKFGVGLPTIPTFTPEVCGLRIALLAEELAEYEAAKAELLLAENTDIRAARVEMLDALCDLQYVLSGAVLHLGLRHAYRQMSDASDASRFSFKGYLKRLAINFQYSEMFGSALTLIRMQRELECMIGEDGFALVFYEAFLAVHENNCAKLWTPEDVARNKDNLAFARCDWSEGFIARNNDGKIIKPPAHSKVDLSMFVE